MHTGSVDVFLDAAAGGVAGIVIWGLHRDTVDIARIGMPLFSLGALPSGPQRLDPRAPDALVAAHVGDWTVTGEDAVFGDEDGILFVPLDRVDEVLDVARFFERECVSPEFSTHRTAAHPENQGCSPETPEKRTGTPEKRVGACG